MCSVVVQHVCEADLNEEDKRDKNEDEELEVANEKQPCLVQKNL